jgi:hypothetical protein
MSLHFLWKGNNNCTALKSGPAVKLDLLESTFLCFKEFIKIRFGRSVGSRMKAWQKLQVNFWAYS